VLTSVVIGGIAGGLAVIVVALVKKPITCASCRATQPRVRFPRGARQALAGGITCVGCGGELDRHGQPRT